MTQLALDLFGDQARHEEEARLRAAEDAAWIALHQVGQIRLPWDTAGGDKAGDLIPAWRCCRCGAIELSWYFLERNHGCEKAVGCSGSCQYRPVSAASPYRMDAHWIPPEGHATSSIQTSADGPILDH